jgi:hypothetical protein
MVAIGGVTAITGLQSSVTWHTSCLLLTRDGCEAEIANCIASPTVFMNTGQSLLVKGLLLIPR